jgi:hypothetical protein
VGGQPGQDRVADAFLPADEVGKFVHVEIDGGGKRAGGTANAADDGPREGHGADVQERPSCQKDDQAK